MKGELDFEPLKSMKTRVNPEICILVRKIFTSQYHVVIIFSFKNLQPTDGSGNTHLKTKLGNDT